MSTGRKVCRKYWFSVEGETEKWYLEWLAREINASAEAKASVKFDVKVCKDPVSRVKQLVGVKELFHVFDIESQEPVHVAQVETTMDRLKKASSLKSTKCHPGYSNFSFELWIVLHKTNGRRRLRIDDSTSKRSILHSKNHLMIFMNTSTKINSKES